MPARGRYTIVRKLAQGGMAEIFLATQRGAEGFERPVVLKRILSELSADPHFCNALIDEAHIAMGLAHGNIVQVLDLGKSGKRYFLAMEFVDGLDLDKLLRRSRQARFELPPALALFIVSEVCRALSYAHGKQAHGQPLGIVHRDISPHNILVSDQGEVKLTDFGIAKALVKRDKTATGVIKGKFAFMSPEQACGSKLDARSDLFSLGSTLYAAVTGRRPFEAASDTEILLRVRAAIYEAPEKLVPGLDAGLGRIIKRALAKEAQDRYQSAEEMLLDAEGVLRGSLGGAGQTELKRWVAELASRSAKGEGVAVPAAAPDPSDDGILIELEEADFEQIPAPAPAAPAQPLLPAPVPNVPTQLDRSGRPGSRRSLLGKLTLTLLLLGGAGYAGYVALWPTLQDAFKPQPTSAFTVSEVINTPDAERAPAAPALDAASPEPDAASPEPDAALPGPDAELPGPDAAAPEAPDAAREPAPPPAPEAMVSVRIVTDPPGAMVQIDRRTFGPTPVSVRFRPAITYELQIGKEGFAPVRRLLPVANRADQVVTVRLAREPGTKKPQPKHK